MLINQRIKILVKTFANGNQSSFAEKIGVSKTAVTDYIKENDYSEPNFKVLNKMLNLFNNLNAEWLMRGEGEMLKQETINPLNNDISKLYSKSEKKEVNGNENVVTFGEASPIYMSKDDIIQSLQFTIKTMNELLKARENEIEQLKKELEVNK